MAFTPDIGEWTLTQTPKPLIMQELGARKWSWREESNPRPADYKSAALPTELRQLDVG